MKQDILNLENKKIGNIELNDAIYGVEVRADILQRVVTWQLAKAQSGNHQTKGRSDVALTAAKPFKKKVPVMLVRVPEKALSLEKAELYLVRL